MERSKMECGENWLTIWESNVIAELENHSHDIDLETEEENRRQRLWLSFQNCATSIAKVYVENRGDQKSAEDAFRNAARDATALYKDSLESNRRISELAVAQGHGRRTKELLQWAKKRRRFIRRDELIAMLAGLRKPPIAHLHPTRDFPVRDHTMRSELIDDDLATFRAAVSRCGDLQTIVSSEFQRVNKRSCSPQEDVNMDSPQPPSKRHRH